MANQNKNKQDGGGMNTVAATMAGAVVGAGLAAGAMILSDSGKRKALGNKLNEVKEGAENLVEEVKGDVDDKKDEIQDKLS